MESFEILDQEQAETPELKRAFNWYGQAWRRYATGKGRAPRIEYWMWTLYNLLIQFIAVFFDFLLGISIGESGIGPVWIIAFLATIVPTICVGIRRMQDLGKHGSWILIALVPIVGPIWFLVLTLRPSQHGSNEYGPHPEAEITELSYRYALVDNVLAWTIIWTFVGSIHWPILQLISDSNYWENESFTLMQMISGYGWALLSMALASVVPGRKLRMWLIVLASIICAIRLYNSFEQLLRF